MRMILALVLCVVGLNTFAASETFPKIREQDWIPSDDVVCTLIMKESNNNDSPKGWQDGGKAHGCLQIWKIYLDDVNGWYGTKFRVEDMKGPGSRARAVWVCRAYLAHYAKANKDKTLISYFCMHNGGQFGLIKQKPDALKYAEEAQVIYNKYTKSGWPEGMLRS